MKDFGGKLAVITGGGNGMGRELARQLVAEGCDVALCDVLKEDLQETQKLCQQEAPQGIVITVHECDVADESQVARFAEEVKSEHQAESINLLFNNAGIGGGGSFVMEEREVWERTFNICWFGVYNCARSFLPMLLASDEGHMVNTSSVNGFWATLGPGTAHTAYSSAKFAVKGFSEALVNDLRINAPHVKVSVVMPGHIGTSIVINTPKIMGNDPDQLSESEFATYREMLRGGGAPVDEMSDEDIQQLVAQVGENFRDDAPTSASEAATIILDGVRAEKWRILVGHDAGVLDQLVREDPEIAYEESFMEKLRSQTDWALGVN
jgi:NAD(P)-dependent dehydrogenase (short-subunit alcohol dehydrogenase family)